MRCCWLAVLLVACGTNKPERENKQIESVTPAAPSKVITLPEPAVSLPRELAFELLDAGQGERRVLRYAIAPGASKTTIRSELSTRELAGGTWQGPTKQPATVAALGLTVRDGGHVAVGQGSGSLDLTLDVRGRLGGLADHDASFDELVQRLLAMVVPVPEAALGTGARWRVVTAFRQQGAVLKQTATYTLVSAGPPWRIEVDIQRLAERQQIEGTELVAIVRRVRGTTEIDPALLAPAHSTFTVESTVHVRSGGDEHIVEDTGTIAVATTSSTSR